MKSIDPTKAQKVWQRVQQSGIPGSDLLPLLQQLQEDLTLCSRLFRSFPEKLREPLGRLLRLEQEQSLCLSGISRLLTGHTPPPLAPPHSREPAEIALRRYYGRLLRRLSQYDALLSDPQFGAVFVQLSQQTRQMLPLLLVLMGLLPQQKGPLV